MNEKLLEAHKKVVQGKLNREVARNIFDPEHDENVGEGREDENTIELSSPRMSNGSGLPKPAGSHNRRFAPHLEGIPEESRANTLTGKSNDSHSDRATNDGNPGEVGTEINETQEEGTAQSQMKKLSTSDPQSLDSGILTRSSSISDLSDTQTDVVTSNEFDTDNETVDVADSDDTDTDSDTYIETTSRPSLPTHPLHQSEFTRFKNNRQKKDFVSELYNTAVAKVPKVIPSDSESLYSSNSTMRKDFEYDSLDINSNCRLRDIYTNPNLFGRSRVQAEPEKDDYEVVNVKMKEGRRKNVAEVYINNEYDASTLESTGDHGEQGYEYSTGEKMMISISGDNESVYSNKLLISVNSNQVPSRFSSTALNFDPDTLERGGIRAPPKPGFYGSADSLETGSFKRNDDQGITKSKSSFFLFRESQAERTGLTSLPPYSSPAQRKPILPPKTRITPKLPPKPSPGGKDRSIQRPLPPPPPPLPN